MSSTVLAFLIIGLGYLLGRINIKGFSLGTAGVIVVALVFGHYGYSLPKELQNVGLCVFVATVGFLAGPGFFGNFKKKALAYIALGIVIVGISALLCVIAIRLFRLPSALCTGLLCGALTSTPGLAAATEASGDAIAAIGYGIGYPFGVIGVVVFVQLVPKLTKCRMADEARIEPLSTDRGILEDEKRYIHLDPLGLMPICAAVVLGCLIGSVKIPLSASSTVSLGNSGGPLLTGLLLGHFQHFGRVSVMPPAKTLKVMREFGLTLFLLGTGLTAGNGFLEVLSQYGIGLFFIGMVLTLIPMIAGYFIAIKLFRLPPFVSLGSICGGMTSTPALGSLIDVAGSDAVAVYYAATYPTALVSVIIAAQLICVLL